MKIEFTFRDKGRHGGTLRPSDERIAELNAMPPRERFDAINRFYLAHKSMATRKPSGYASPHFTPSVGSIIVDCKIGDGSFRDAIALNAVIREGKPIMGGEIRVLVNGARVTFTF